jgi:hypothetical protein
LRALGLVDADERWLAAHGQAHILRFQVRVDAMRHLFDRSQSWSVKGLDGRRGSFKRRIDME